MNHILKSKSSLRAAVLAGPVAALLALALGTGNTLAADGTWILNGNANWSNNTTAWSSNVIADGVGATATFTLNLTSNRNFTFDTTSRTLGTLNASATGRSSNFLTSGGAVLTLDNTGITNAVINVDVASGQNQNLNVPIELMDSLSITNGLASASGKSLIMNNTISSKNGALTITHTSTLGATPMTNFNGLISDGTGSISLVNAAGIINIGNAGNTFSGTTTNTSGVIRIDNSLALKNSALNSSGSIAGDANNGLRLNAGVTALTLGGLTGSKDFAATGGVFSTASSNYGTLAALTLNPATGATQSYSGGIANGAASMTLTKTGAGTQILSGTSTYTGATFVDTGTFLISTTGALGNTAVTVDSDAAIGGDGTIAGSLSFTAGADFVFSVSNTLDVTGPVTFGGFGVADLVGLDNTVADGTYTLINGPVNMTNVSNVGFGNAFDLGGGKSAYLQAGSLELVVTSVPEPSSALLCGLGPSSAELTASCTPDTSSNSST